MVFLTGITGLVGEEVARQLLKKGYQVRALVRNLEKITLRHPQLEYVEGDVLDITTLVQVMQGATFMIHAAAVVSFAPKDRKEMYKVNIEGTANMVNAAIQTNVSKYCQVSSIAAFGRPSLTEMRKMDRVIIDENQKWVTSETNSNYAITKHLSELEVWRGAAEGLNMVIVNPSIILGSGNWNRSSTQLFKYAYQQRPFFPEGYLNFVDVRDVAEVIIKLCESNLSNERYCVSAGMVSYKEFLDAIAIRFNKKKPWFKVTAGLMGIIWRIEALKSFFTGKAPLISKETAKTAQLKIFQKNDKIKNALKYNFRPLHETLDEVCSKLSSSAS